MTLRSLGHAGAPQWGRAGCPRLSSHPGRSLAGVPQGGQWAALPVPLSGAQETDVEGMAGQRFLLHPGPQGGLHDNDEGDEGAKTLPASLTEPVTMG